MKAVLVTGGTVRLGKAIADRLRSDGWRVLTSSHRADAGADIVADLSEPMGAAKLYAAALQLLGGKLPDALVNNAALFTGDSAAIAAVNLEAPKKLTMMMAGREAGVGAVVNVLDSKILNNSRDDLIDHRIIGSSEHPGKYGQTKLDLMEWTKKAAVMFASTLRVTGVAPGPVLAPTDVHVKAGETLLDRRPTAEDVAAAVSFLLAAEAVTGTAIPVDAGQHLLEK